jgi:DNA mismatch repair protein MutH
MQNRGAPDRNRQLPFATPTVADRRPAPGSVRELELRAHALSGRSMGEVAAALGVPVPEDERRAKGFVGQLVERALGADPSAGERPDFPELGVELKTIPLRPDGTPVESTFCCSIRMGEADRVVWPESRLERRLRCVLWIPVEAAGAAPLAQRRIGAPKLWRPSVEELALLRTDWEDLIGAIGAGGTPGSHVGRVLQVRPKAANSAERTVAPTEDGAGEALPLGFYLRPAFTAALLAPSKIEKP